jgi:hypothetical protein
MPISNESSFKQRIDFLKEELAKENGEIASNLNEKGVECALLIPMVEHLWGFDALKDIKYEYTSDKRFERFDFLLDNKLLIEAKRLNSPLSDQTIDQIEKYIIHHTFIKYGILTNGCDYLFFIKKEFVKEFLAPEEKLRVDYDKEVFLVMKTTIFDEQFYSILSIFTKDMYHQSFSQMAKYFLTRINGTRATKIADDKDINLELQKRINETTDVKQGALLKDIQAGNVKANQILIFNNGDIKIKVVVMPDGRVKLLKNTTEIINMMKVMDSEFSPLIDLIRNEWKTNDFIFEDTQDVIRIATNKQRLKNTYAFK